MLFGKTVTILEKVLDLRSLRHNLIVSNIANMDTPGYQASELAFGEELAKALRTGENVTLKKTHPRHLPVREAYLGNIRPKVISSPPLVLRSDLNSVDIDKEMAKLAENTLMYNALAQILSRKFLGLKNAIQEGRR
jgi:flagellar basal-body rod protein FlgB